MLQIANSLLLPTKRMVASVSVEGNVCANSFSALPEKRRKNVPQPLYELPKTKHQRFLHCRQQNDLFADTTIMQSVVISI